MNLVNVLADYCTGLISGGIPEGIGNLVHLAVIIIQIVVPILLIIWGMLDFAKSIIGQDEDKIKAGQKVFIQRLIAALLVFLVVTIVRLVLSAVGTVGGDGNQSQTAWSCAKEMVDGH